ncbi:MAG: hypothetical protein H6819_01435 [Phycisphaerales bacterium]|nr:hypothetical protein [Phycisphaerales bacterium]MCB9857129.1 hypothetical protein [Phycisphaerales bacterium]MCB9861744.1 hypothetical protein [Phycisphaerales bacterium]
MAALKKHLMTILFGVAVVGSLGLAGWAYTAGDDVMKKVKEIESLSGQVRSASANPANIEAIKLRAENSERRNKAIDETVDKALAPQKYNTFEGRERQLLIPGILPEPKRDSDKIDFKGKYIAAFAELNKRLNARDKPTALEIQKAIERGSDDSPMAAPSSDPWRPDPVAVSEGPAAGPVGGPVTKAEALRSNPQSVVSEEIAKSIYIYVNEGAMGPSNAGNEKVQLNADIIWHAHMTLWIAQDFVAAIAKLNEARAAELQAAGRGYDAWVGNMPVKHIRLLQIDDKLGRGGSINVGMKATFADSFTKDKNDAQHFMVPLKLQLVVEEASVMNVLEAICSAGYYTPIRVDYKAVEPNAKQVEYIYGDDPVVEMTIDLEGYFFRVVYDEWIPEELKKILATPDAVEERKGRG